MQYDKALKKWKKKLLRFHKRAEKEFYNRAFRNCDNDCWYIQIESAIEKLVYYIDLWFQAFDYSKENPK